MLNFYMKDLEIFELVGESNGYNILVNQKDTLALFDGSDEKEMKIEPLVYKGNIPLKRINGNVVRKKKLISIPKESKVLISSLVQERLFK